MMSAQDLERMFDDDEGEEDVAIVAGPSASAGSSRTMLRIPARSNGGEESGGREPIHDRETEKELRITNEDDFQSDHLDSSSEEGRFDTGDDIVVAESDEYEDDGGVGRKKKKAKAPPKGQAKVMPNARLSAAARKSAKVSVAAVQSVGASKKRKRPPGAVVTNDNVAGSSSEEEGSIVSDGASSDSGFDEDEANLEAEHGERAYGAETDLQERRRRGSRFLRRLLADKEKPVKDLGGLDLKHDHESRPLWIDNHGKIILEGFSAIAEQAQDFLVAIAEPVSRPSFIHEYRVNEYSLYAAMSVGLETQDIVEVLGRLSKTPLPKQLVHDIHRWTASYGKLKLVLKRNRYSLESAVPEIIQKLLADPEISSFRTAVREEGTAAAAEVLPAARRDGLVIPGTEEARKRAMGESGEANVETLGDAGGIAGSGWDKDDLLGAVIGIDRADEMDEEDRVQSFEIDGTKMETVKRRCQTVGLPVLEEYDFRADTINPNLDIDLKPMTVIRPYQETSLSKMFGNGRARSGIIVLPCGAGKTLVGITAACTIKKSVLVLCTSAVSAQQWKQAFIQFTNVSERQISVFTASSYDLFHGAKDGAAGIVISVYSMVAYTGQRSHGSKTFMDFLQSREWGCLLLDEVHVAPANAFRKCLENIRTHAKLGLTATLVREDDRIADLNYIIGPKLYEANWMDLAKKGHIANVQCAEVWCKMTPQFYREYLREASRKRILIHVMNPSKFQACQFLIRYHEARGDKIIVFSDNVYALMAYATKLQKAAIHGGTPEIERMRILSRFQHDPNMNTIFLSKVGDTSIDLPEATCLIQISSHYGSRRQEAQRLGRILRAKRRNDEGFNAFFYSLVSKDTAEMYYSTKRQGFLVDQGYAFKVITELHGIDEMPDKVYPDIDSQLALLHSVLLQGEDAMRLGDDDPEDGGKYSKKPKKNARDTPAGGSGSGMLPAIRMTGSMTALSGAQHMSYREQEKGSINKQINREDKANRKSGAGGGRSEFFRKEDAMRKKVRQTEVPRASQDAPERPRYGRK